MPDFEMLQVEREIASLVELFRHEGVRSYLEIGSRLGGSLWRVANELPAGSRVVSVDLRAEPPLRECVWELQSSGYDAHLICGNSQHESVVESCRSLGPYDAVLLDGDHTRLGVFRDWEAYSSMGRLIAFHDIAWFRTPTWGGVRIDVPELWNYLRWHYRSVEFRYCPTGKNNGIGVIWRQEGYLPMGPEDPNVIHA